MTEFCALSEPRPWSLWNVWTLFTTTWRIRTKLQVTEEGPKEPGEVKFLVTAEKNSLENSRRTLGSSNSLKSVGQHKAEPFISGATFGEMFPFHMMFDRRMEVIQAGRTVTRIAFHSQSVSLSDTFECLRPKVQLTFANILAHINTVFVLIAKFPPEAKRPLRLKGQMIFQWQTDTIVFIGSPSAVDLEDLHQQGVCLADLSLHDASRDRIILSEDYNAQYILSQSLELMTNDLRAKYLEVDAEKEKTESLIYSLMPPEIVDDLRHKRKVQSRRFPDVTIIMTGIEGFSKYCENHEPIEIVNLLNECFSIFDNLLANPKHCDIYKVETVLDHYLAISGCPKNVPDNAKAIVELAIDIRETCAENKFLEADDLQITFGVNSGEIVSGIIGDRMPRYCLFGDCINIASRTQTNGKKGSINITQSTYDLLQISTSTNAASAFHFLFFGNIPIKGKTQPMPIWTVDKYQKFPENSVYTQSNKIVEDDFACDNQKPLQSTDADDHSLLKPVPSSSTLQSNSDKGFLQRAITQPAKHGSYTMIAEEKPSLCGFRVKNTSCVCTIT
ncbi:guanylate cyclase soluble subunit beta-1-like isoform X2 [Paramacrobiotus metropolitanus]|uniref:guanylate cyclase soluble subunit beta-1-like isoform X2 n=1 Tax=Paramacrobiotus metropolitanus TaxID=2943436 RepID=UPI0024459EE7|nr:guanylate cyclase soluble subunit beta-1-like isoform X2 [Paramacrobiotus metropolitanus]